MKNTNINCNTIENWKSAISSLTYKKAEYTYSVCSFFVDDTKVSYYLEVTSINRQRTQWEALFYSKKNDQTPVSLGNLRAKTKKDAFDKGVNHLVELSNTSILVNLVNEALAEANRKPIIMNIYHKDKQGWFISNECPPSTLRTAVGHAHKKGAECLIRVPNGMDAEKCSELMESIKKDIPNLAYKLITPYKGYEAKPIAKIQLHLEMKEDEVDLENSGWWYPGSGKRPRPFKEVVLEVYQEGKRPVILVPKTKKLGEFHIKMKELTTKYKDLRYTLIGA